MTAANFDACLHYVLIDEGGNDDDPNDHGGRTSRGITQREYDAWSKLNNKPGGDVWKATADEIREIYRSQYWNPYCDDLPSGIDYIFFDTSVNAGRGQAVKSFQKALGISVDGMMGQVTLAAIKDCADVPTLIHEISEVRRNFYRNLAQFPRYGKGWLARVDHCEHGALALGSDAVDYAKPPPVEKTVKADPKDVATATIQPESAGAVSAGSGGLMGLLNGFQETLVPYKDTMKYVNYVLLAVAVVGFGYAVWGLLKRSRVKDAVNA